MKVRCLYRIRFLKLFRVQAITLYPWILFASSRDQVPESLFRHELEHIYQVRKSGWFRFYVSYLKFYFQLRWQGQSHKSAYLNIPYEAEARESESFALTDFEKVLLDLPQRHS